MELAPFLAHLESQLGDSLRAVQWYRNDETELIFLRDDLDVESVLRRGGQVHERLSTSAETMGRDFLAELGAPLATMSVREDAFLLHLPVGDDAGVIVGFDSEVGRDLHDFISNTRDILTDVEEATN